MWSLAKNPRISNYNFLTLGYKCNERTKYVILLRTQTCNFTKKTAEEMLGLNKPKRPLNPFFKYMTQMRPALLSKIPGISSKEAIVWSSKHWQEVDRETKSQLVEEYRKNLEDYKKRMALYLASLTDQQKTDIKKMNDKIVTSKERRKLRNECKISEKPKKPMSSYLLYIQSRNDVFPARHLKEYQEKIRKDWLKLSDSEKAKFDAQAKELMIKYQKDMEAWELKMISLGHSHLVRKKAIKKPKLLPKQSS